MTIINKITGRDVSSEYLALMENLITNEEFEIITLTPGKTGKLELFN